MPNPLELEANLRRVSPRFTHPRLSLRNVAIYGAVVLLWVLLTVGGWFANGIFAWATGLSYVLYDTFLLLYVARKTYFILQTDAAPAFAATGLAKRSSPTSFSVVPAV